MAQSLLAYLYPHIRGSQEDIATLALSYILAQSSVLRTCFTAYVSDRLMIENDPSVNYYTQASGKEKERPDLVGINGKGIETIVCEVKFYAALTDNQPNGYLRRMLSSGGKGLIFLCPQTRQQGLWQRILQLAGDASPKLLKEYCCDLNGIHMAIMNWHDLLNQLEQAASDKDPGMREDLHQLSGYCAQIDSQAFIPFKPGDFGPDVAQKMDRYNQVVLAIVSKLMEHEELNPSLKGLKTVAQLWGLSKYMKLDGINLEVSFRRDEWKRHHALDTPFWIRFCDADWVHQNDLLNKLLTISENKRTTTGSLIFLALEPKPYLTLDEMAEDMANQVIEYLKVVKSC